MNMKFYDFSDAFLSKAAGLMPVFLDGFDEHCIDRIIQDKLICAEAIKFFKVYLGSKFFDLMLCSYPSFYIVSSKLAKQVQQHGLTGCVFESVTIINKNQLVEGFYVMRISGRCEQIRSEEYRSFVKAQRLIHDTEFQIVEGWDGSDFFLAEDKGYILCSQKAKDILDGHFQNVKIVNLADYLSE